MKAYKGKYPHKIREVFTIKSQLYVKTNSVRALEAFEDGHPHVIYR